MQFTVARGAYAQSRSCSTLNGRFRISLPWGFSGGQGLPSSPGSPVNGESVGQLVSEFHGSEWRAEFFPSDGNERGRVMSIAEKFREPGQRAMAIHDQLDDTR